MKALERISMVILVKTYFIEEFDCGILCFKEYKSAAQMNERVIIHFEKV